MVLKTQTDIEKFIQRCTELEDKSGFISNNFFDLEINKIYKFSSGPLLIRFSN